MKKNPSPLEKAQEGAVWMAYDASNMGDTNNGLAVVQALKPKHLLFEPNDLQPQPIDEHRCRVVLGEDPKNMTDRTIDLRTQSPEVILYPSGLNNNFLSFHKGEDGKRVYNFSMDKSMTVRLNAPDKFIDNGLGAIRQYKHAFDADLNIVYAHQVEYIDKLPPNTIVIETVPTRVNTQTLAAAGEKWATDPRAEGINDPSYLVIVGERVNGREEPEACERDCKALAETIAKAVKKTGGSVAVATSPRTRPESSAALRAALAELLPADTKLFFYDYKEAKGENNPYLGLLARSKRVLVTEDSMSMLSDIVAAGKPLFVFNREAQTAAPAEMAAKANSHEKYLTFLKSKGYVQPVSMLAEENIRTPPPYNSADAIAAAIKEELQRRKEGKTQQAPVRIPIADYLEDSPILSQKRLELMHEAYTRGDGPSGENTSDTWSEQLVRRAGHDIANGEAQR